MESHVIYCDNTSWWFTKAYWIAKNKYLDIKVGYEID